MKFLGDTKPVKKTSRGTAQKDEASAGFSSEITPALYMRAGYPIVHIRTEENERAVSEVRRMLSADPAFSNRTHFSEWKSTSGLIVYDGPESSATQVEANALPSKTPVAKDILSALSYIEDRANKKKADDFDLVSCFHNIRYFLSNNFVVVQKLRDIAIPLKNKGDCLFIIGPSLEIPAELSSVICVYDLALPTVDHFSKTFNAIVFNYKETLNLKYTKKEVEAMASAAVGMTELQGENALSLSLAARRALDPKIVGVEKEQAIKRGEVIEFIHSSETMDDLGGFDVFKGWLAKRADSYTEEAREYGLRMPRGVLLLGLPGTGKSLCVKCISNYLRIPLLKLDMGKIFKSLVGSSEANIRSALKTAEAVAPVVVWIDEIEKGMAGIQSSGQTDSGTTARVMSTILTWMQENKSSVFIAATANNVESLPPELLRKGRFTEIWGVVEPNDAEREDIWKIHICKVRPSSVDSFDYKKLVEVSSGYTGAEIEGIVEEALFDAWSDGHRKMTTEDLIKATLSIVPQSVTSADKVEAIRKWMERRVRFVSKQAVTERNPFNDVMRKLKAGTIN